MPATDLRRRGIPDATVARLPAYLRVLDAMAANGVGSTSSEALAAAAGVRPAKLRKDLSHLGTYGVRGVGYEVASLSLHIARALGVAREWRVVIVGIGNLGRALAGHAGLTSGGFAVAGLYDHDPEIVGQQVAGRVVEPMSALADLVAGEDVIGVIAAPAAAAQGIADALVAAGVTSILSFAGATVAAPAGVDIRGVDVTTELRILAFRKQRREAEMDLVEALP